MKAQEYLNQHLEEVFVPAAAAVHADLKTTSEMLRAERKNLIEDFMRSKSMSIRLNDVPTMINGKVMVKHKHAVKQKDGAHRNTASFQLLEKQVQAMQEKLSDTNRRASISRRQSSDARAVLIKANVRCSVLL
jgi:hypothetical protein